MHTLLSAFFAMLFGFGHSTAPAPAAEHVPTRTEIAQSGTHNLYAETACVSCRRMNVTYRVR